MSIPHPDSVGKVQKILLFETVFHDSASDCTKLTLGTRSSINTGASPNKPTPASAPKRPATIPTRPGNATSNGAPNLITAHTVPERPGCRSYACALAMGYHPATPRWMTKSATVASQIERVTRKPIIPTRESSANHESSLTDEIRLLRKTLSSVKSPSSDPAIEIVNATPMITWLACSTSRR